MSRLSKSFPLILILIALISNVSILVIKPVSAQSNTAPTISIVYPTNETHFNVSIAGVFLELKYETNDTLSWVGYSIDGGSNLTVTGNSTADNMAFIRSGYHFESNGYHTLTLYANDTDGNWATPQTVTYLVTVYSDATSMPSNPSLIPLVTVVVIVIGVLAVAIASFLFYRRHRKTPLHV